MSEYDELKRVIASGWNTWNTRSVLSHVLLPQAFAINLALKDGSGGSYLKESFIGQQFEGSEQVRPGPHAYDGSYTELYLSWRGTEITVKSAAVDNDLVLLVVPQKTPKYAPQLIMETGILWNRPGYVIRKADHITAHISNQSIDVFTTGAQVYEPNVMMQSPYLPVQLDGPVGVSTGVQRSIEEITSIIEKAALTFAQSREKYGEHAETFNALQTCLAWDTIYEPLKDRVVSTVSRIWNYGWGGYILFCWDNYFAAYLASIDNKELAYSNAIEITREMTEDGFVPNFAAAPGLKSWDRSQPPVGSMVVRELYRTYRDKWLLEELFDSLLRWNRWWEKNRDTDGFLCWGAEKFEPETKHWESYMQSDEKRAALESGLDNSPMYDDIPFDFKRRQMKLADVGLMSMYIVDCDALADIAGVIGRKAQEQELRNRGQKYRDSLKKLWNEKAGIFENLRLDTREFSPRLSPTNFYPMLAKAATPQQAKRMIDEHFYNPEEFWGDWIIPSISRNDPAYKDQNYWRGRIWAPMNFLVYLGMRNYSLDKARKDLSIKSSELLMKEWLSNRHVHENYCGDTGEGCNHKNSDRFYHWGGLLGLIPLIEAGVVEGWEKSL